MFKTRYLIITALVLGVHLFAQAQSPSQTNQSADSVELIEDKQPKRWLLYAQNNTDEEQEAFLMVQGTGFRRSADRPVIKRIPPREKILMITLIPLKGVTPTYTKVFTWETDLQTIKKRKGENDEEHVNIRPLKPEELTIFLEDDCEKCDILTDFLNTNHYKYRILNVGTNHKVKEFMFDHLSKAEYQGGIIDLPAIMYQGRKHWSIIDIRTFIKEYDWRGLKKN